MRILLFILVLSGCPKATPKQYFDIGKQKEAEGDNISAIKLFTKAIEKQPKYIDAYIERAKTWVKEDSMQNAIKDYDSLLLFTKNIQDKQGEFYLLRGNANYLILKDKEACADWEKSRQMNNSHSWDCIRKYCK